MQLSFEADRYPKMGLYEWFCKKMKDGWKQKIWYCHRILSLQKLVVVFENSLVLPDEFIHLSGYIRQLKRV